MLTIAYMYLVTQSLVMNFYMNAAGALDRLDAKKGSIKGVLASLPEKDRKRSAALIIETLKCTDFPTLLHNDSRL